jgi:O-antigen/teichoic acid export membrane protein
VATVTATADGGALGLRRVLRGGIVNLVGTTVGAALNLALIVMITRAFSQDAAGLLFAATSVFMVAAAVANVGAPDGLVYFIARMRVFGRADGAGRLLRLAMGPTVAAACLLGLLMLLFADPMARALGTDDAATYLRLLALFLPFAVLTDTALAATRAHHDMSGTAVVEKVGRPLAQVVLVGAIAFTGAGGLLALAWAGPYLPAAVLAWFWLGRILRRAVPAEETAGAGVEPDQEVTPRAFWTFALPRAVAGVAQMGLLRGGVILVALLNGLAGAAVFTAATRVMAVGQFGTQAVLDAAQPRFAEQIATGDHAGVRALYRVATAWLVCLTWPLYLLALVFAPEVMRLFGSEYRLGAAALVVVCAGQLAASALGMGDLILAMTGRTGLNLLNNVLALVANVLVCLVLVPPLGATGAATALVGAVLLRRVLPLWQLRSMVVLHPFSRPVMSAAASALVWFGAVPVVLTWVMGDGLLTLGAAACAGALGHLASVWCLRGPLKLRSGR